MPSASFPSIAGDQLPWLTTEQMVEVDRVMIDELHIELMQMMENAGRSLAMLALDLFGPTTVTVCAGSGGNGGGGLVAARHLLVAGVDVQVVLSSDADRFGDVPKHQLDIVNRLDIPVVDNISPDADLVLDAIIGYSLNGPPRGRAGELIEAIRRSSVPVVALDTPSGLDTSTGHSHNPHVPADATLTLAAPKVGLRSAEAVGELYVGNISVPPSVYLGLGFSHTPNFAAGPIVHVL